MVRGRGFFTLGSWLARRSLSSISSHASSSPAKFSRSLVRGVHRKFGSANFSHQWSRKGNRRNWLQLGLDKPYNGQARLVHGTAYTAGRDYYETLGISKIATASEIKKAYYGLAKKLHPDINKNDPEAEKKFQQVQKAYEVLKDDENRQVYDQVGHDAFERAANGDQGPHAGSSGPYNMEEMIQNLFRMNGMGGKDVEIALELSFMEAIQGCTKTVTFQTELPCKACGGTGVPPGTRPETCKRCRGSGVNVHQDGVFRMEFECVQCGGSGKIVKSVCRSCSGRRVVGGVKSVNLNVMPGVDENEKINVPRSGGADPEGNQPGDLDVIIKVRKDPTFRRQGRDIHVDAVVSITQAILGGCIQVPTLTGDVAVKVYTGTQHGQKVVLKGKGIRTRKSSYAFGNQYVHFVVSVPTKLTPRQQELIEEFSKQEQQGGEDELNAAEASG